MEGWVSDHSNFRFEVVIGRKVGVERMLYEVYTAVCCCCVAFVTSCS